MVDPRADGAVDDITSPAGAVALLIPAFDGGGGERITLHMAPELSTMGFAVDLVVGSDRGPLRDEVPDGVRVVDLGRAHLRSALVPLVRYLRERRPTAILPTVEHASVLALCATRLARTRTSVIVRVANTLSMIDEHAMSRADRLVRTLVRTLYPTADALVACSHGMADDLAAYVDVPRSRIDVIGNATITRRMTDVLARQRPAHPWMEEVDAVPVVLAIGRLAPQKNFALLIEAFARVVRDRAARLVILGEGPLRGELEAQVERLGVADHIDLPGFDANPYAYLARARVFALSSDWEGLPGVLIEALACGAAVVATNCPSGPDEILQGGRYGRLVPVGAVDDLAVAILAELDDPRPAPAEAWEPYTATKSAAAYASLISELKERRRAP